MTRRYAAVDTIVSEVNRLLRRTFLLELFDFALELDQAIGAGRPSRRLHHGSVSDPALLPGVCS